MGTGASRRLVVMAIEPQEHPRRIEHYAGNEAICEQLSNLALTGRVPHSILLSGPEGVGKATLARRFAALLLGDPEKIEADDLSLPENRERIDERLSLTSEKRAEDPLFFASHPDFLTFPPEGPLRQISIQQMRLMKDHAQFNPLKGHRRVFLIDEIDRANEQAANSLLKILEEPPPYLLIIGTTTNPYELLPTIRSRSVMFYLNRLRDDEVRSVLLERGVPAGEVEVRARLSAGCPGKALTLDIEAYRMRAAAMLTLLEVAAGRKPFAEWLRVSEASVAKKTERLEDYLEILVSLLQDLMHIRENGPVLRHPEYRDALASLAETVDMEWIVKADKGVARVNRFLRRNIQKTAALDDYALELLTLLART
ncbi:MAG: DNA polymerase III subunit [Bryobacterales bacterium]|nr:DNA polymerase III subunit [Bryobacterales bacterium]